MNKACRSDVSQIWPMRVQREGHGDLVITSQAIFPLPFIGKTSANTATPGEVQIQSGKVLGRALLHKYS